MKKWYVASTKHRQELLAAANLREQKYSIYLPKRHYRYVDGKRHLPATALRFPGYIFVAFDASKEEHGPIANTRGIDELLVDAREIPLALPEFVVPMLRDIEEQEFGRSSSIKKPQPRDDLEAGNWVLVNNRDHWAAGKKGVILELARGIAKVLIGFMPVELADIDLKKLETEDLKVAA